MNATVVELSRAELTVWRQFICAVLAVAHAVADLGAWNAVTHLWTLELSGRARRTIAR